MTTFADLYHPALGNVHIAVPNDPTALALYESHGWVLSAGGGPDPTPIDLTVGLGDLRYAKLGDIPTAGTPTGDALRAAYGARGPFGGTLIVRGDSTTRANSSDVDNADSWASHLADLSGGSLRLIKNAGVSGQTTAQLLATFTTDVLALNPSVVGIMAGVNDATGGIPTATTAANLTAMVQACRNAGVACFLGTPPPRGCAPLGAPAAPTVTASLTGGTLTAGTYTYAVTGVNENGETVASATATATIASGTTGSVQITAPVRTDVHGWWFFGRTAGSLGRLAEIYYNPGVVDRTYVDTGSATPGTAAPVSDTTGSAPGNTILAATKAIVDWVRKYGRAQGIPVVDFYAALSDVAGGFRVGQSWGGLHPSASAQQLMGTSAWQTLAPFVRPGVPGLTVETADPLNVIGNALLLDNQSGVYPTGWTYGGLLVNPSVAPRTGFLGDCLTLEYTTSQSFTGLVTGPLYTLAATTGDRIMLGARLEAEMAAGQAEGWFEYLDQSGNVLASRRFSGVTTSPMAWATEINLPSGVTGIRPRAGIFRNPGKIRVGELTVRNLSLLP